MKVCKILLILFGVFSIKNASAQIITTVAGNGTQGLNGNGGPATLAQLNLPWGLMVDSLGNIYISDSESAVVRKVDINGIIDLFAGSNIDSVCFGDGGLANQAGMTDLAGLTSDKYGNLYIAAYECCCIRKVDTNNIISTPAGNDTCGYSVDSVLATLSKLALPYDVAIDNEMNLFIADYANNKIKKVDQNGIITTVAGTGYTGPLGDNGPALSAGLDHPQGIYVDTKGNLYIADTWHNKVRKVDTAGIITTYAGLLSGGGYNGDNIPATTAYLNKPFDIVFDTFGNGYIADRSNNRVRRVDTSGIITTFAGTGVGGYSGDNIPANTAQLWIPQGIAIDMYNNLYIADSGNNRVRKIAISNNIKDEIKNGCFKLYPNPTNSELQIQSSLKIDKIKIIDILGNELKLEIKNLKTLDVTNLQNGVYFITLSNGKENFTQKFIVSH